MEIKKPLKVVWSLRSLNQFQKIFEFIKAKSPQGADAVRNYIIETTDKLPLNPMMFEPDRFKLNNDKSYRAFTEFNIRITYKINLRTITILKAIHTSQQPKLY